MLFIELYKKFVFRTNLRSRKGSIEFVHGLCIFRLKKYRKISQRALSQRLKKITADVIAEQAPVAANNVKLEADTGSNAVVVAAETDPEVERELNDALFASAEELADNAPAAEQDGGVVRRKRAAGDVLHAECPVCQQHFASVEQLHAHTRTHARPRRKVARVVVKRQLDPDRPHQCVFRVVFSVSLAHRLYVLSCLDVICARGASRAS